MTKSKKSTQEQSFPSKEDILSFIAGEKKAARTNGKAAAKIGKREIAKAFNIKGQQRIALKQLLRELEDEGAIERQKKTWHKSGQLPSVALCDVTGRDSDGELIAKPVEWDTGDNGPAPVIIITQRKARRGQPVPGVGDRALVRCEKSSDAENMYSGRVIKLLPKTRAPILGIYRLDSRGMGRIEPVDKKNRDKDLEVIADSGFDVKDGDLVSIDIIKTGRYGIPRAKLQDRLGHIDGEKSIALIALINHNIPHKFSADALAEAEHAKPMTLRGREDWRKLPLITIDPADAKDHDDAVHAKADDDPKNNGGFVLTVAIADVAAYVKPGSAMDHEALERGNSVYFPGQVVPMLPERISNDLCSLREKENRPALAVQMRINSQGQKIGHSFHRVMMRSAAKLSYQQAQNAIDGNTDNATAPLLKTVLQPLWQAYDALKIARGNRHPLDLDLPERRLVLDNEGKIERIVVPPRLDAHKLIEEFMILANVAAAETLEDHKQRLVYRAHDEPSVEKITALADFLASLDIKVNKGEVLRPRQFNGILAKVKGGEHENSVNEIILRTQAQAEYVADNYGHFGLNLQRYAHFTSPIRRYADLIVHRALVTAVKLGKDGLSDTRVEELPEIAARISAAERRAMAAERETTDRLIANHLAEQIGATFSGRIAGVTRAGLFVKLDETGADGFIPIGTIGSEYYHYDEAVHALVASGSGAAYQIGQTVEVRLAEALPMAGALRFELLSKGVRLKKSAGSSRSFKAKTNRGSKNTGKRGDIPRSRPGRSKAKKGKRR